MLDKEAIKKAKGKYKLEGHLKSERVKCSGSQNEESLYLSAYLHRH